MALVALAWALLGDDFKAWSPRIAKRLIRNSAARLPAPFDQRYERKWLGELAELPTGAAFSQLGLGLIKFLALAPHLDETLTHRTTSRRAPLDLKLLYAMRVRGHGRRREETAIALSKAGRNGFVWLVSCLALAALDASNREAWLVASLVAPLANIISYAVRLMVRRPRPVLEGLPPLMAPSGLSFPSAHAVSSFAAAVVMMRIDPATAGALLLAVLISLSRPYLGLNYPSDVVAGALLGVAFGFSIAI